MASRLSLKNNNETAAIITIGCAGNRIGLAQFKLRQGDRVGKKPDTVQSKRQPEEWPCQNSEHSAERSSFSGQEFLSSHGGFQKKLSPNVRQNPETQKNLVEHAIPHKNLIFAMAKNAIRNSSQPCLKREMLVVPYCLA
jgi:hypothetical protein